MRDYTIKKMLSIFCLLRLGTKIQSNVKILINSEFANQALKQKQQTTV